MIGRRAPRVVPRRLALVAAVLAGILAIGGCPRGPAPSPVPSALPLPAASVAPPTSATGAAGRSAWRAQAERCIARLEEVVTRVEADDREGARAAEDKAYREEYENADDARNLEVASGRFLPEEMFEGKMRNVVVAREDTFGQIRGAIKAGAPAAKVRSLVDELSAKIRADAAKLDADAEKNSPPH